MGRRRRSRSRYCKGELIEREDFSEDLAAFKFRVDQQLPFIPVNTLQSVLKLTKRLSNVRIR